eukprot:TRINITY_DN11420_c0_g1_i1.p1 TRINITY_DN11420_c0_g1~~TRINITY_DN11420_c0_g1_i1.p1  ORF type:complete len:575 (+),score=97.44 TRINITY_DN11420_c0_g1_i1:104-1726(+)
MCIRDSACPMPRLLLSGSTLSCDALAELPETSAISITEDARERILRGRARLLELSGSGRIQIYGTNTGVGVHKTDSHSDSDFARSILVLHATRNTTTCSRGPCPVHLISDCASLVRESLTILCNHYCTGAPGVSLELAEALLQTMSRLHGDGDFRRGCADELWSVLDYDGAGASAVTDVDVGAIVVNSAVAVWLIDASGYCPQIGEALPMMSYNAVATANARRVADALENSLTLACLGASTTICALRCDPAPFSPSTMASLPPSNASSAINTAVQQLLRFTGAQVLDQSKQALQDPLSTRCFAVCQGAALQHLARLRSQIHYSLNTNPINPIICEHKASTSPFFDAVGLRLEVQVAGLAVAEVGSRCYSRLTNSLDPGHNGGQLPLGLGQVHNRNIPCIASSCLAELQVAGACAGVVMPVRMADGVEDVCSGLSHACRQARRVAQGTATLASCEFLVGFEAARCQDLPDRQDSSQVAEGQVPTRLRHGSVAVVCQAIMPEIKQWNFQDPHPQNVFDIGILKQSLLQAIHKFVDPRPQSKL